MVTRRVSRVVVLMVERTERASFQPTRLFFYFSCEHVGGAGGHF